MAYRKDVGTIRNRSQSMLTGALLPNIIQYTIPIILTSLLQLLFNAADLIVVGHFCGSIYVGAVGATGSIINLILNLFMGISVGVGVTVAHALGGRNDVVVHRAVHTALPIALIGGVILTFVGILFSETFLLMMDTPGDVLKYSTLYMKIYFAGVVFSLVYNFCASILRAAGDTKSPLILLACAGVLNVILNVIFVCVFHMDVDGVALATIISQAVSAILVVITLMKREDACKLYLSKIRIYKAQLFKMIRIGLPAGIQGSLFSISNVLIQSSINGFGPEMVSGCAAAGNIEGFVYASMNAFSQTAVNFVGQNAGAGQYKRVRNAAWVCIGCVSVVGLATGVGAYLAAPYLLPVYIKDSQAAIEYGLLRMMYVSATYFLCGLMDVTTGALRGIGSSITPMIISVLGVCGLRILWIYTVFAMPDYHTPGGLFISYPISWTVTFACQLTMFIVLLRKRMRSHNHVQAVGL